MDKHEEWKIIMDVWELLLQSPDEVSYNEHFKNFTTRCARYKTFVDYVQQTWLVPFKEKFVQAWANRVIHLGNTTTNRYINYLTLIFLA